MIVKNESHVIVDTLKKLLNKIRLDCWVICDTGSTDITKQCIRTFFQDRGISGELIDSEWKDFAHNRTVALQSAFGKTDYVLMWDADDEIVGNFVLPTPLDVDWYAFQFGTTSTFIRPQLFKNSLRWRYKSVLHEYAECVDKAQPMKLVTGAYHCVSGRSGFRNLDPNKYLHDARILEKAYYEALETKDPLYTRYAFYAARSYINCKHYELALEFCKKVLSHDNWSEEKYCACIDAYSVYKALGKEDEGLHFLVKAHTFNTKRVEAILKLIVYYACCGEPEIAYNYYKWIQNYYEQEYGPEKGKDWLFVNRVDHEFMLPYYMIIVADKTGRKEIGVKMYEFIVRFQQTNVSEWHINNVIFNAQFFVKHLPKTPEFIQRFSAYIDAVKRSGKAISVDSQSIVNKIIAQCQDI